MSRKQLSHQEVVVVTRLLMTHFTKVEGSEFWAWEKGWDDARIARESRIPGVEVGHITRLRKSAFGDIMPRPASETRSAIANRLIRLEARIDLIGARVGFIEQQLGVERTNGRGHDQKNPLEADEK